MLVFPGGSDGNESACNLGGMGSIPGSGRSAEEGNGNPLQYSCLENPHRKRSLADYSTWDHKESDTMEQLNTAQNSNRFVTAFLPRSKHLSWLQSLPAVILETKKIKSVTICIFSPSICYEVMRLDAMIFVF